MTTKELNAVTCGACGRTFGHELNVDELYCPYCGYKGDISDFPDLYFPPRWHDSIINITKEEL